MSVRSILPLAGLASTLIAFVGCHKTTEKDQLATEVQSLKGSQAPNLASRISGQIVLTRGARDLVTVSVPAMQETVVRRTSERDADFGATIHAISGPDSEGRIAYIEDYFFVPDEKDRKHLLKTIKLDGTADAEIFSRPGDAMWALSAAGHGAIGTYLSACAIRWEARSFEWVFRQTDAKRLAPRRTNRNLGHREETAA